VKVVIDTNVFISSFLSPKGNPRKLIDLWKTGAVTLCLCSEILTEYVDVLQRFGLEGEPELAELFTLFKKQVNISFIVIEGDLRAVKEDPDDNKFIECAVVANATHIISGDKHLLKLKQYQNIRIVSAAEFIKSFPRSAAE